MQKTDFYEINRKIWGPKRFLPTLPTLVGGLAAIAAGVVSYWKGFDSALPWLLRSLLDIQAPAGTPLTQFSIHVGTLPRLGLAVLPFCALYLGFFAYYASALASGRRNEIEGLREEKKHLVEASNYRDQLASAVGLRYQYERITYDIVNFNGDCKLTQEGAFDVLGLRLDHLVRRHRSTVGPVRKNPVMTVEGQDTQTRVTRRFVDNHDGTRTFHIRFAPALWRTKQAITMRITEEIEKSFLMYGEAIPEDWGLDEKREFIAQEVTTPIERLELIVLFPLGYQFTERSFFRVHFGKTHTAHDDEEARIRTANDKPVESLQDGRTSVKLSVEKPVVGLSYYLCWRPPSKSEFEKIATSLTATEKNKA